MEHSDTLHLVLRHKWYDMIESGKKSEEYREINDYWKKRFEKFSYSRVRFHRGYTSRTLTFELKKIKIGTGNPEWGAPCYDVFILKLGRLVGCS